MSTEWQCEKTEENQLCKESFKTVTTKPNDTELTVLPNHNSKKELTEKHIKTQGHDKFATALPVDGSTNKTIQEMRNLTLLPENDDSANAAQSTTNNKEQEEENGAMDLRVVLGVVSFIFIVSAMALMSSKSVTQFCPFSRTKRTKQAGKK